jgi:hypothetical protein
MENIDIDLITSDQSVDPKVQEVYELLKIYRDADARGKWLERRKEAWKAIENEMWDEKDEKAMTEKGQVPLVINKCVEGVQGKCAIMTHQKPTAQFLPIGSGDLYAAELLKRAYDYIFIKNEGNDVIYECTEEYAIGAHAFLNISVDKATNPFGNIVFEEDPPDDIYWDKDSRKRDYSDTHLIKAKMRSRQYIKDKYGELKDRDIYFAPFSKEDDSKSTGVSGEDNYAVGPDDPLPDDVKSKQKIIWEIKAWLLKIVEEDWIFRIGPDGEPVPEKLELGEGQSLKDLVNFKAEVPHLKNDSTAYYWRRSMQKRILRVIVGKKMISEEENPYGVDREGYPQIDLIGMKAQRTRSSYCMSATNYALPINKEKNKRRSQAIYIASMNTDAPIVRPHDAKWEGKKGTPGAELILAKNAPFQPYRLQTGGAVEASVLFNLEQKADEELNDAYKILDVMKGKIPPGSGQIAGKTVLALQDFGGVMNSPDIRKLESALIRHAKVVIALALKHWPRQMWERLLEPEEILDFAPENTDEARELEGIEDDQEEEKEGITQRIQQKWAEALDLVRPKDMDQPPGLSLIDLDVKIVAGSGQPTNRIAKMEMAIELVKGGIYDPEAALEYVDDPNKDKIIERMKNAAEMAMQNELMKKAS